MGCSFCVATRHLFTPNQRRSLLLAINKLSKSRPPEDTPSSMKSVAELDPYKEKDRIIDYHSHEDYHNHLEDFDEREDGLTNLFKHLWEPFRNEFKDTRVDHELEELRLLRNRFLHTLNVAPTNANGFLIELNRATWTTVQWAEFVLDCLRLMQNYIQVNETILLRNADDLLLAASQEKQKLEHHRADLHSTIEFLTSDDEWNQYIGVQEKRGKVAIDRLAELLDPEKARHVVQICGEGGLGKTALMREFIRRNITEGSSTELYDGYLILSSKSTTQGEVNTLPTKEGGFQTTDPVYPKQGPIRYSEGLTFVEFKRIISAHAFEESTELSVIHRAIHDNRFLIVLDNFEDCSDSDRKEYLDLFDSLKSGCESRIIITGRKEASADDIPTIRLGYLSSEAASKLLHARYMYLQQKHSSEGIWEFRNAIYNALNELRQVDFIRALNASMLRQKDVDADQLDPAVFRDRVGHPLVILRLAVEMGRPDLPGIYESEPNPELRLIKLLTHIAKDNNFISWQHEVSKWVTDKAYEDIASHPECVLILYRLLDGTATLGELKEHVNQQQGTVEKVPEAIQRLESHQILIRHRNDGRYEAAEQAKSHIYRSVEDEEIETQETTKVADSIENILDGILRNILDEGDATARQGLIQELVSSETPLHRRKSLTTRSYRLIQDILKHIDFDAADVDLLNQSFAELASSRLGQKSSGSEPTRKTISEILLRSLYSFRADAPTIHRFTRNLKMHDIAKVDPNTKTLFSRLILRAVQQITDLYPIHLADTISMLAAAGGNSNTLISDLKNAWKRISSHPNVQHGMFDDTVQAEARKLLFRMAQNDDEWRMETADLLNQYQAEDEPTHWDDVHRWFRYALPPTTPTGDILNKISVPNSFVAGTNGLSFDQFIDGMAVFQTVEHPIVSEAVVADESTLTEGWSSEECAIFEMKIMEWFRGKIVERPHGFAATDLTNFIHRNYGRTKEVIPKATHGEFVGWMPWFENVILSQPDFQSYYLDRPSGTHVVITRKNTTENPNHWLFDDTSGHAPNLPMPLHMYEILNAMSGGKTVPHNIRQIHNRFLLSYTDHLKEVYNKEPTDLNHLAHIDCLRKFIDSRIQLADFTEAMIESIDEQVNDWAAAIIKISEKKKTQNHRIPPIRRTRKIIREEE